MSDPSWRTGGNGSRRPLPGTVAGSPGGGRAPGASGILEPGLAGPDEGFAWEKRNGSKFPPHVKVQQVGAGALRRHFLGSLVRWVGLLAADLTILLLLRAVLTAMREGPLWNGVLNLLYPVGFLGGGEAVAAMILGLVFAKAYAPGDGWRSPRGVIWGTGIGVGIAAWQFLHALGPLLTVARWLAAVIPLAAILVGWRKLIDAGVNSYFEYVDRTQRVILVGNPTGLDGEDVARTLARDRRVHLVGWLTEDARAEARLGHPSRVWEALADANADVVILCGDLEDNVFGSVVEAAFIAGCRVLSVPRYPRLSKLDPRPTRVHGLDVTELTFPSLDGGQKVVKRTLDLIASVIGLVLLSPLLALIALAICLDSKGPIVFRQERVGFAGEVFRMLKFRTMRRGADQEKADVAHLNRTGDSRLFKIPNDPRITRVGGFLRRWSLDELPQLLNVIRGEMSLIGPRPFFPDDLHDYRDHHFMRLAARPGITGMWQVFGRSDIVDFEEVVRLDCQYINRWSLGLDLQILARTLPAVMRRQGAY